MKNLLKLLLATAFIFQSCGNGTEKKATENHISQSDTLYIKDEKAFITFKWTEEDIEKYKQSFGNEDDFYTVMDDIGYYTAESTNWLDSVGIRNIEINKNQYKILAFKDNTIRIDTLKIFDFVLYQKGKKPIIKDPTQIDNSDYYSQSLSQTNSPIYQLETENLVFSFQTKNGKTVSICMDKDDEYIVYRFGTNEKIELEYPERKDNSSFDKFEYSGWVRHGGVQNEGINLNYFTFTINNFKYIVYDTYL